MTRVPPQFDPWQALRDQLSDEEFETGIIDRPQRTSEGESWTPGDIQAAVQEQKVERPHLLPSKERTQRRERVVCRVCKKTFNATRRGPPNHGLTEQGYCPGSQSRSERRFWEIRLKGEKKWRPLPEDHPAHPSQAGEFVGRVKLEEIVMAHPLPVEP